MRTSAFLVATLATLALVQGRHTPRSSAVNNQNDDFDPEPDRYIVRFKDSHNGRRLAAGDRTSACESAGVSDIVTDIPMNRMTVVHANNRALRRLNRDATVEAVEKDHIRFTQRGLRAQLRALQSATAIPYGVTSVQGPVTLADPDTSHRICIIDSGLDADHPELARSGPGAIAQRSFDLLDTCSHGTHVAGTCAGEEVGVVPGAPLAIVRVFSGGSNGCDWVFSSGLIGAVAECRLMNAKTISMSLGGGGASASERAAFDDAWDAGIVSVAAAGNSGNTAFSYPASYDSVISVAAIDSSDNLASFSQRNSQVDIAAPGVGVRSAVNGGGYSSYSGTSMATPHVSAVIFALQINFPSKTVAEIRSAVETSAIDLGDAGRDNSFGHGKIQYLAAAQVLDCEFVEPVTSIDVSAVPASLDCSSGQVSIPVEFDSQDPGTCSFPRTYSFSASASPVNAQPVASFSGLTSTDRRSVSLNVVINTDNYPEENSFQLTQGTAVLFSAALSADQEGIRVEYNEVIEFTDNGSPLVLTFTDSYGDGICCGYGDGDLQASINGVQVINSDGQFGDDVSGAFADTGSLPVVGVTTASFSDDTTSTLTIGFASGADYTGPVEATVSILQTGAATPVATQTVTFECTAGPPVAPPTPTGLALTAATPSSLSITWSESVGASSYVVSRDGVPLSPATTSTSFTDSGLTANTGYSYSVVAFNGELGSDASAALAVSTTLVSPPDADVDSATPPTSSSITIQWTAQPEAQQYEISRTTSAAATATTITVTLPGSATSYTDTDVSEQSTYVYRIRSTTSLVSPAPELSWSPFSDAITVTTLAETPAAPEITGSVATPTTVTLRWIDNSDVEDDYIVTRSTVGEADVVVSLAANSIEYIDSGLSPATEYVYTVAADNAGVQASDSVTVSTLEACVPAAPEVTVETSEVTIDCTTSTTTPLTVNLLSGDSRTCEDPLNYAASVVLSETDALELGGAVSFSASSGGIPIGGGSGGVGTLQVTLKTDRWGTETAFKIFKADGSEAVSEGPFTRPSSTREWTFALPDADGPHEMVLTDSYGDGMCCSYGRGSLTMVLPNGVEQNYDDQLDFGSSLSLPIPVSGESSGVIGSYVPPVALSPGGSHALDVSVTLGPLDALTETVVTFGAWRDAYSSAAGAAPASTSTVTFVCRAPEPPAAPTDVTVTTIDQSTLSVAWTNAASAAVDSFEVQQASDAAGPFTDASSSTGSPLEVTGLTSGTEVFFRVRAVSATLGASEWSAVASGTTLIDPPAGISGDVLLSYAAGTVTITFTDGSTTEEDYNIEQLVGGEWAVVVSTGGPLDGTDFTYEHVGAAVPGTSLSYRVVAVNAGGSTPSAVEVLNICDRKSPRVTASDFTYPAMPGACSKANEVMATFTVTNEDILCDAQTFDTTISSLPVGYEICRLLEVTVEADEFPLETSFAITSTQGGSTTTVLAGGVRGGEVLYCHPMDAALELVVTDSAGDGFSTTGTGLSLKVDSETLFVTASGSFSTASFSIPSLSWSDTLDAQSSVSHTVKIATTGGSATGGGDVVVHMDGSETSGSTSLPFVLPCTTA